MNKIRRFGEYGGQYVPEIVMNAVNELNEAYETYKNDPEFLAQLRQLYRDYANRPSLLYYAEKMTKDLGGAKVYLKREDLNHTGAHKINNVLGQILLAKRMGKKRIIAETGAGQHGVAPRKTEAPAGKREIQKNQRQLPRCGCQLYRSGAGKGRPPDGRCHRTGMAHGQLLGWLV